jgi:uncharacterized protein (TIGR00730 family)
LATNVAVFGSSEARPGDTVYELSKQVGSLLAEAGFGVVNGGYGGVMEACSLGARESGGMAIGITCLDFRRGAGNKYLTEERPAADLFGRTRSLIDLSAAYIILPGKAGTLAELAFLWALLRGGLLVRKPVVLLGEFWNGLLEDLQERGLLEAAQAAATGYASTPEEAVGYIRRMVIPT